MESIDFTLLPPLIPDEMLFLVAPESRDLETYDVLAEIVAGHGGTLAIGSRNLEEPPLYIAGQEVLTARGLQVASLEEAYDLVAQLVGQLEALGEGVIVQPNWLMAGAPLVPGHGSGGGPGARPLPLDAGWAVSPLQLRDTLLQPLRAATYANAPVRLVFLDAWNSDASETQRLQNYPIQRLLNNHCLGEPFRLRNYFVSRDLDPFPMPDHGLFAAYLAGQVIGGERLCLHDSVQVLLTDAELAILGDPAPDACVTVEAVRVLDEYGVGDSKRLIQALVAVAESMQPGERVIVNMSLVMNIPVLPPANSELVSIWPDLDQPFDQAPPQRLDRALYEAIRQLHDKGALLVAAAGNASHGEAARHPALFPAAYEEVVGVTAANAAGSQEAYYANRVGADGVAIFAGDLLVTSEEEEVSVLDENYLLFGPFSDSQVPISGTSNDPLNVSGVVAWAGTSFATPLASGLAALLWSANPSHSAAQVRAALQALAQGQLQSLTPYIDLFDFSPTATAI